MLEGLRPIRRPAAKPAWLASMQRKVAPAAPQVQDTARHKRLKPIARLAPSRQHAHCKAPDSASRPHQLRPLPPQQAPAAQASASAPQRRPGFAQAALPRSSALQGGRARCPCALTVHQLSGYEGAPRCEDEAGVAGGRPRWRQRDRGRRHGLGDMAVAPRPDPDVIEKEERNLGTLNMIHHGRQDRDELPLTGYSSRGLWGTQG